MLSLSVADDNEIIQYLNNIKGKLPNDVFLITIDRPGSPKIMESKKNVYSNTFTYKSMNLDDTRTLINFIKNIRVESEKRDIQLAIHSPKGRGVSRGIATFLFLIISPEVLSDLYYNTFDVNNENFDVSHEVFKKLEATYNFDNIWS